MSLGKIRIGQDAPAFQTIAKFFDGETAEVRRVHVRIEKESPPIVYIDVPDYGEFQWGLGDIRAIRDQASDEELILTSTTEPMTRLVIADPKSQAFFEANCPNLNKGQPVRGRGRILAWAVAAVGSVALIITFLIPQLANVLAERMPPAGEKALGDTTLEQIRSAMDETGFAPIRICESPAGLAALETMHQRLIAGQELPYALTVTVLDHPMINAFALPGGHVVFFRGLIDAAQAPDEVASVFAHEIGHVAARDPTRIAVRSAGSIGVLGLLLGDFAGGTVVLFMVERLIQASYTQEAEAGADVYSYDMLIDAGISPRALGDMFGRLRSEVGGDQEPGIMEHFNSHPEMGDRI